MSIRQRYAGKRVLLTGVTGFLGKVILEKYLYSVSTLDKVYVLIRGKEGADLFERFKKEVVSSACFDRLRSLHKAKFEEFIKAKVQPIQGDLLKEGLGLSKEDEEELVQSCNVVINCAASIDFNAPLDYALEINVRGAQRMLQLAKKMKNLLIFTHVSTSYVNSDKNGLIKQEIFKREMEPQEELLWLQKKSNKDLIASTAQIVGNFPNTYTYTKNLSERLLKARKGSVPVCIVRPAIINPSYAQPTPGWVDSLAAAVVIFLFVGLGIVKWVRADHKNIGDVIPVDIVANYIIVATAMNLGNTNLPIYHIGSSDRNPLSWGEINDQISIYWNGVRSASKISKSGALLSTIPWKLNAARLKQRLPSEVYLRLSTLLGKQHQKTAHKIKKTILRGEQTTKMFKFVGVNNWIYQCKNVDGLIKLMTPQDRQEFLIDIGELDAKQVIQINNYGIQKFILKEDAQLPNTKGSNLLKIHSGQKFFSDCKWALNTRIHMTAVSQMKQKIFSQNRVMKAIQLQVQRRTGIKSQQEMEKLVHQEAEAFINDLIADVKLPLARSVAWGLHKSFKSLFEKININLQMVEQIREISEKSEMPIVLLPTHRSYLDLLIVSYVFLIYSLRLPRLVADEALLQANLLPFIFRSCGAFFFREKDYEKSYLYRSIFDKYIELLLRQNTTIEFFIEGSRSKTGKILAPKFQILNVVLDAIIEGKIPDACIIPVTINYEKVLQGDTFPGELLGEELLSESLIRVIKCLPRIGVNHGQVYINICKPFYPKAMIAGTKSEHGRLMGHELRQKVQSRIGAQIIHRLTDGIVIMSTAIVSSVLLMHRKGIEEESLIKMVNEVAKYLLKKGCQVGGVSSNSSAVAIRNAITYLEGVITKTKKNVFQLTISAGNEFQKILMLSYYRNTLIHAFIPEAFICFAIVSFGEQLYSNEGILLARVYQQSLFLSNLLKFEYLTNKPLENYSDFMRELMQMKDNEIIEFKCPQKLVINLLGSKILAFYCSLIKSQVECYWACLLYVLTIARSAHKRYETSSLPKFYDTIQWYMESLFQEKIIEDYEACSLESIKNAFDCYQEAKFVKLVPGGKKKDSVVQVLASIQELEAFQAKIKFFKKTFYNSFISPTQLARQSIREVYTFPKL